MIPRVTDSETVIAKFITQAKQNLDLIIINTEYISRRSVQLQYLVETAFLHIDVISTGHIAGY